MGVFSISYIIFFAIKLSCTISLNRIQITWRLVQLVLCCCMPSRTQTRLEELILHVLQASQAVPFAEVWPFATPTWHILDPVALTLCARARARAMRTLHFMTSPHWVGRGQPRMSCDYNYFPIVNRLILKQTWSGRGLWDTVDDLSSHTAVVISHSHS